MKTDWLVYFVATLRTAVSTEGHRESPESHSSYVVIVAVVEDMLWPNAFLDNYWLLFHIYGDQTGANQCFEVSFIIVSEWVSPINNKLQLYLVHFNKYNFENSATMLKMNINALYECWCLVIHLFWYRYYVIQYRYVCLQVSSLLVFTWRLVSVNPVVSALENMCNIIYCTQLLTLTTGIFLTNWNEYSIVQITFTTGQTKFHP